MRGQQKRFEEAENIFYLFIGWRGRPPALEHQFGHAPDLQHARGEDEGAPNVGEV